MISGSEIVKNTKVIGYGMVGGGEGAFIGDAHRKAAALDGKCRLMAGCFSRDFDNTKRTGENLGLSEDRLYRSYEEMAAAESQREDGIDFVTIVTPNSAHFSIAKTFLENGISVVCDKPLVLTVEQGTELAALSKEKDLLFCVTYTYSGYPMVKQAREMIRKGNIGDILFVMAEYPQDWLLTTIEKEGSKQASWRTDPKQSGVSNCMGDIGSHIENTVACITGLTIKSLSAKLDIVGEGRTLDNNGSVMLKYDNGGSGMYWASQIACGNDNGLKVRVFGTKGSIEWRQEDPNYLRVGYPGQPIQIMSRGQGYLESAAGSRLPAGHPEGYYEAFASIYSKFASAMLKKKSGEVLLDSDLDFPSVEAGIDGVKFIINCVRSSNENSAWIDF